MSAPDQLIVNVVEAAMTAQRELEGRLTAEYLSTLHPVDGAMYSFRSIGFDSQFMLEKREEKMLFLFFHVEENTKRLMHSLKFELRAAPSPPFEPSGHDVDEKAIQLGLPFFMLTDSQDTNVRNAVADAVKNRGFNIMFGVDPQHMPLVLEAGEELRDKAEKGRGPVSFSLAEDGNLYLVVFVSEKDKPDGLYLYHSDLQFVFIFSVQKAELSQDTIMYEPVHRFALAVHDAIFGPNLRRHETNAGAIGVIPDLDDFAAQLAEGYRQARQTLATAASTSPVLPSFFEIGPLQAKIRYSTTFDDKRNRGAADIIEVKSIDDAGDTTADSINAIVGTADIAITANGSMQTTEVTIGMPSFVVSGNPFKTLLTIVRSASDEIVKKFEGDSFPPETYQESLRTRNDAVVLQSFDKSKPTGNVLVIWQGTSDARGRQFIFTCKADLAKEKLSKIHKVLALGQDVAETKISTGNDGGDNQYQPFHNMFHAILLWKTTLRSE